MLTPDEQNAVRKILSDCEGLGFDRLTLRLEANQKMAIRVAHGVICRENIWEDQRFIIISGEWQDRELTRKCQWHGPDTTAEIVDQIQQLRREVESLPPDREASPLPCEKGDFTYRPNERDFAAQFGPEVLYPAIEAAVAPVRAQGLRVTGFVEAKLSERLCVASDKFSLATRDAGVTIHFMVDNGDDGAGVSGAAERSTLNASPDELKEACRQAVEEAAWICASGGDTTGSVAPGDYTVVLGPRAVRDLLMMTEMLGFFSRRIIDEGMSYLSDKSAELKFPSGLTLGRRSEITWNGQPHAEPPISSERYRCDDLDLIRAGEIVGLYTDGYWADKKNVRPTFGAADTVPTVMEIAASEGVSPYRDIQQLIKNTEQGIYVANVWYLRLVSRTDGIITGMTRDGLFEIRDGKLSRRLTHMRWHDNPFHVLQRIDGATEERQLLGQSGISGGRGLYCVPALRSQKFHFSSVSRF